MNYFESFKVEFFVGQKYELVPTFHFLINLPELFNVAGKEIEYLKIEIYLICSLYLLRMRAIHKTGHKKVHGLIKYFWGTLIDHSHFKNDISIPFSGLDFVDHILTARSFNTIPRFYQLFTSFFNRRLHLALH